MTALEKLHKQKRATLLSLSNKIKSDFSFKKIGVWKQVYDMLGDPPASNAFEAITFIALKDFLEKRKATQEASFVREITEAATPPPPAPIEDKPVAPEAPLVTNDESGIHNA